MYAQVLVFQPIRLRTSPYLDYEIPVAMLRQVRVGTLVSVPLRTQVLPGLVMGLSETSAVPGVRPILSVLDPDPVLSETLLQFARWMARETLAPLHRCVQIMLPPGLRPRPYLRLTPRVDHVPPNLPRPATALLALLVERGPLKESQAKDALVGIDLRRARQFLKRRGYIEVERLLRLPRVQPRTVPVARLVVPRDAWPEHLAGLQRTALYEAILGFLEGEPDPVEFGVIRAETGAEVYHIRKLEERGLLSSGRQEIMRDPLDDMIFTPTTPPKLTPEQALVWEALDGMLHAAPPYPPVLLLGVTGSGKTELYLRAAAEVLARGRQALVLVPEISLTPQTLHRFAVRFEGQVGLWHSSMSQGERYDTWRRVRSGELAVVVGARSALFAPFPDLGLIVMDEEEDTSYKQNSSPYYHTREAAEYLARTNGALLVMGSATPSLESYARARHGRYRLLKLPSRIMGHRRRIADWLRLLRRPGSGARPVRAPGGAPASPEADDEACTMPMPEVQIVDMRAELKAGNRSIFSVSLQQALDRALSRGEQAILFLNRRGSATHVFCRDCGWVATCPRCDIPLTHHARAGTLICHRCGHRRKMVTRCPQCGSRRVRAFGLGTEGLETRVGERWPAARILRWDRDVARSHGAHTLIMDRMTRGDADILVGTQMVARGLDLPRVTLVGVISADTGLQLPDFRAAERTFQLLAQVVGRSGRGVLGGRAIIQTYHPDHYVVRLAAAHDYETFAERELAFRRKTGYPPAIRLARLVFAHHDNHRAQRAAEFLALRLRQTLKVAGLAETDLIGPVPAFFARVRGRYRWQILLRHVAPADFLRDIDIPAGWVVDIDPLDIL